MGYKKHRPILFPISGVPTYLYEELGCLTLPVCVSVFCTNIDDFKKGSTAYLDGARTGHIKDS